MDHLGIAIVLAAVAAAGILWFLSWRNRAKFVWRADSGESTRIINRLLCQALEDHFSAFLRKYEFKLVSDPEQEKALGFWIVVFRCNSFDLMFGGRGEVLVSGRPTYCRDECYSIAAVLAFMAGESEPTLTESSDLDLFANAMDERYAELCNFFSAQGEEMRLKYRQWEEQLYWRRMGRKGVPANAV